MPRWGDGQEHSAVGASPPSTCFSDTGLRSRKPWSTCGPIQSVSIPPCTDLLGWQPSRFLSDRAEAERAFALAEELGSVNAAAAELGITWPSLRKAFARHGLGMPARNPEAVRQRAIAAATQRAGQPTAPTLDPVFVALNQGQLPAARGPHGEHGVRLRRGEEIETLSYRTVVELNAESRLSPQRRVATIAHRPKRAQRLAEERTGRSDRRQVQRAARTDAASSPAGRSRRRGDADRCPISPHPARAD